MKSFIRQEKALMKHQGNTNAMDKGIEANSPRRQWVKRLLPLIIFTAIAVSGQAHAEQSCGKGKVLEVKEGGWNWNGLMIKIDYSVGSAAASNHVGYIRFRSTLIG